MRIRTEILEEAAHWLIELNAGDADRESRRHFDDWLRQSPEHLRAYLELLPGWEDGAALPVGDRVAVEDLIEMGRRQDANVVPLASPAERVQRPASSGVRHRKRVLPALAASIAMLGIGGIFSWKLFLQGRYTTEIGQQRAVALDDGSTMHLNAGSRVRVRFTSGMRSIEISQGQALFDVAKDAARPFVVKAGDTQVRAIGTQFDVNRRRQSTIVTVVEGVVAVLRTKAFLPTQSLPVSPSTEADSWIKKAEQGSGTLLKAGEQVTVNSSGVTAPRATPDAVVKPTDWAERRLIFDDSNLGEVIEEFNRYNERRLVIQSRELESFPITATFSSPDPTSLMRFLETQPTISIVTTNHEIQISNRF